MSPDAKARRREKRRTLEKVERRNRTIAEVIHYEAISRSQMLRRSDRTVWGAYEDLKEKTEVSRR